ncbi:hypothetical protein ACS0PU_007296 [Formica fusca]
MTDVQMNPDGRLQTGKGNKVKPIRSFGAYVIVRASTEAKNLVSFFPREKQINASRRREEAPPIDLSFTFPPTRCGDSETRLHARSLLADSIVVSTSRPGRPNEWSDCFQSGEKFGMRANTDLSCDSAKTR